MKAPDFAGASREVLAFLHQRIGMDLWVVSRTDNEDWVVLAAEDHGYGIHEGDIFRWADTFCSRMVIGDGPRVAPSLTGHAAYAAQPIARQLTIGAYVGMPLVDGQGRMFGTLCGIHPTPMPPSLAGEQPMVEVFANMLSGLLSAELAALAHARAAEAVRSEALTDPLTGLANRRGWEIALAAEEERCRRYGTTACVVAIELDGLWAPDPAEVRRAAQALRQTVRKPDTLARLDDGRFVVLGVACSTAEAIALLRRIEQAMHVADLPAALGLAMRHRNAGLSDSFERALDAMGEHREVRARA